MQEARNCGGRYKPALIQFSGVPMTQCPWSLMTPFTSRALKAANGYRDGFLPKSGGMDKQDARLMTAIRIYLSEYNRCEARNHKAELEAGRRKHGR